MTPPGFDILPDVDAARRFIKQYYRPFTSTEQTGLVLVKHGHIAAAALYDWNTGSNIWMQVAGTPGRIWLTRAALAWAFKYPFEQVGVDRITTWVESTNTAALRINKHMGFVQEAVLNGAGRNGVDALIFVLKKEDCRYV